MDVIELRQGRTTAYLLAADRGYLLIDTGWPWTFEAFESGLDRAGVGIDEIEHLLLTHHHDDHAGFLHELIDDVTVIAHETAPTLLEAGENARSGGGLLNRRVYLAALVLSSLRPRWDLSFPPVELRETDILVAGDDDNVLREISIDGTILHTPGHSVDSISVLLDDGRLYCGDAAMNGPPGLGTKYHTIYIGDIERYHESWRKILDSAADRIHPSHGSSFAVERLRENSMGSQRPT